MRYIACIIIASRILGLYGTPNPGIMRQVEALDCTEHRILGLRKKNGKTESLNYVEQNFWITSAENKSWVLQKLNSLESTKAESADSIENRSHESEFKKREGVIQKPESHILILNSVLCHICSFWVKLGTAGKLVSNLTYRKSCWSSIGNFTLLFYP